MTFLRASDRCVEKNNSLLCVGLDSEAQKLPDHIKSDSHPQFAFNKAIIDATQTLVCAYKLNSAFYEARGAQGITELKMTCDYIHENYSYIPIILDAKRGDIGSTNEGYVQYAFDYLGADAITLHPYLGREALQPFLDRKDKGCIILCKTSNPGAGEIQDIDNNGKPLYQVIAEKVVKEWNANGNCLLVVGAPYPEELAIVRRVVGDMTLLIPGIGAQGGDMEQTVKAAMNAKGAGMTINVSRAIIFASRGEDFAGRAQNAAVRLKDHINTFRPKGGNEA